MSFQSYLPHPKSESPSDVILAQRECITKIKDALLLLQQWNYNNWNKFIALNTLLIYYTEVLNKNSQNNPLVLQFQNESENSIKIWDNIVWKDDKNPGNVQYKVDVIVKILIELLYQNTNIDVLKLKFLHLKKIFPSLEIQFVPNLKIEELLTLICSNLELVLTNDGTQKNISKNLYNSLKSQIENIIATYIANDTNYNAKLLQQSLELTFANLITIAEPYRAYTTPVDNGEAEAFKTFLDLQSRESLIETKNDPNGIGNFFKIQQAKGLKSIPYKSNAPSWKNLCEEISSKLINTFAPFGNSNYLLTTINNLLSKYFTQKANADSFLAIPILTITEPQISDRNAKLFDSINFNGKDSYADESNFAGQILNYYDSNNVKKYVRIASWSGSTNKATLENSITLSSGTSDAYISNSPQSVYGESGAITFPISYSKNDNIIFDYTFNNTSGVVKYDSAFFENNILSAQALPSNYSSWNYYKTSNLDITQASSVSQNTNAQISFFRDGNDFKITKKNPLELASGCGYYTIFAPKDIGFHNVFLNIPSSGAGIWANDIDFYIIDTSRGNAGINKLTNWNSTPIDGNFVKFSNTYNFLNTAYYKFCIHFKKSSENNDYVFNSPFISKGEVSGTVSLSNTNEFLTSLNFSNFYRLGINNSFNFNRVSPTKLSVKSLPYHTGPTKKIILRNASKINFTGEYSGYSALQIKTTGNEKKYYDIFFELLFAILKLINNYAIARMMVPEAFDPEEIFNNDFQVRKGKESIKSFIDDLLEDSGLTFEKMVDRIQKDPRADMLRASFPYDFPKEIEWKSGKLADAFNTKSLQKIKSSLSAIKKNLNKVQNLLNAVRSFVEILDALITLGEDLLSIVLGEVINQLNKTVDSFSSLGVYFLPLWQTYETGIWKDLLTNDGASGAQTSIIIPFTEKNGEISDKKTYTNDFYSDLFEANKNIIEQDSIYPPPYTKNKNNDLWGLASPFRATTYSEFISNIEKCFLDPDDNLDPKYVDFQFDMSATDKREYEDPKTSAERKNEILNSYKSKIKEGPLELWGNMKETWMKPGRPLWTSNNTAKVVILAATFPAPADFSGGIKGLLGLFLPLIEAYEALANTNTNIGDDLREVLGLPDEDFSSWGLSEDDKQEFADNVKAITASKWWSNLGDNLGRPTLQEILDKNRGALYRTGEPPNFIGLTMGSIFSGPIYFLKNLISRLETWAGKDDEPSLADVVKSWINKIDKRIQKIEETISGIENFINLIDKILNISFTYLIIDSTGGVDDIMAQLETAKGFPNEEESQIILGCVIGYSAGGTGFDMSSYFTSIRDQFREERAGALADLRIQNEEDGLSQINKFFGGK